MTRALVMFRKTASEMVHDVVSPTNPLPVALTAGGASITVAEDAPLGSGASGIPSLGQRVPAVPAAQTSAAGDAGFIALTSDGKQVTAGSGAEEHTWQGGAMITNSVASTAIKTAGAGVRNYVTDLIISNRHSTAVDVTIFDGAVALTQPILLPTGGTVVLNFNTPLRGSVATAINAALSAAVAGSVTITAIGYIGT